MTAHIIALEGIDQSGKQTQSRLLAKTLRRLHHKVGLVSFPIYNTPAGLQIRRFLDGKRGYPAEAVHMLYSLNRWENLQMVEQLTRENDFLIADRYTPSNLAYGISRGLSLQWLRTLDQGFPTAELVIVLDTPIPSSFARKQKGRDVHEKDRLLLSRVRKNYKILSRKLGWKILDGSRPVESVRSDIWNLVQKKFETR
jgi:dTMP kinase